MADNVDVTAGTGTTIATDDASGAHYQCVKLVDGAADSTARIGGDATNGLDVDVTRVAGMPTGANATPVQGTVAHDSAAANNPVLLGAVARSAAQTAVAAADVAMLVCDLNGRQVTVPYTVPEKAESYTSPADITDTADDEALAAAGAGVKHYITHFSAMCSHADTGTWVVLKQGSTVIYSGYCAAAGGGFVATFPVPLVSAANAAINVANITNSSATRCNVSGYQAP